MYIRNIKLNGKLIFKIVFFILIILVFLMFIVGVNKIFDKENEKEQMFQADKLANNKVNVIQACNYTNVLKTVHDNVEDYVGQKIEFTGFVYRLNDFKDNQFVLGRQMIISSDMQAVVVGFLCDLNGADKYADGCWVKIRGTITKGDYHGDIPVLEIEYIKECKVPNDEYVYPPDKNYIPTAANL